MTMTLCVSAREHVSCCDESDVKIYANGDCLWGREFQLSISHCPIDITWFPFDDQQCDVVYESKTHESRELNFTVMSPAVIFDFYTRNGEWDLLGTVQQA